MADEKSAKNEEANSSKKVLSVDEDKHLKKTESLDSEDEEWVNDWILHNDPRTKPCMEEEFSYTLSSQTPTRSSLKTSKENEHLTNNADYSTKKIIAEESSEKVCTLRVVDYHRRRSSSTRVDPNFRSIVDDFQPDKVQGAHNCCSIQRNLRIATRCESSPAAATALNYKIRPLVLATHLVPSLPIALFESMVELIEDATNIPVVLLSESRINRDVAKDVVDIAILPAAAGMELWDDGKLIPVSFVFDHKLNKDFSPKIYADIVVHKSKMSHIKSFLDLRGSRCSLPDRDSKIGAATLLFNHLREKGEGPSFFGNILDAYSQASALQMVAFGQAEVCILQSPVLRNHSTFITEDFARNIFVLKSLGPLPPYSIVAKKDVSAEIIDKITSHLLQVHQVEKWKEKFVPFGVLGFSNYNTDKTCSYNEGKPAATSAPYY